MTILADVQDRRSQFTVIEDCMNPGYEEWMVARGLRPNTIKQRLRFEQVRSADWGTWELPSSLIATWLNQYDGWTALTYYAHLTSIYEWLLDTRRLDHNPMTLIRRPAKPRPQPRPLSPQQVTELLDGTTGNLRAYMLLALLAGLRIHEIVKLRGQDITAQEITVVGKGGQLATIPTHPDLWKLAQEYPRIGYWFPSEVHPGDHVHVVGAGQRVARRFRKVGIEHGSIHRLRATYGTNLARSGVNLRVVQTLMRHSSLATTEYYLGVSDDERMNAIMRLAA